MKFKVTHSSSPKFISQQNIFSAFPFSNLMKFARSAHVTVGCLSDIFKSKKVAMLSECPEYSDMDLANTTKCYSLINC